MKISDTPFLKLHTPHLHIPHQILLTFPFLWEKPEPPFFPKATPEGDSNCLSFLNNEMVRWANFSACWYKFRKAKSYFNNYWVGVVKYGCNVWGHESLKLAVSPKNGRNKPDYFACGFWCGWLFLCVTMRSSWVVWERCLDFSFSCYLCKKIMVKVSNRDIWIVFEIFSKFTINAQKTRSIVLF